MYVVIVLIPPLLSLSLSLTHTHTHTHSSQSLPDSGFVWWLLPSSPFPSLSPQTWPPGAAAHVHTLPHSKQCQAAANCKTAFCYEMHYNIHVQVSVGPCHVQYTQCLALCPGSPIFSVLHKKQWIDLEDCRWSLLTKNTWPLHTVPQNVWVTSISVSFHESCHSEIHFWTPSLVHGIICWYNQCGVCVCFFFLVASWSSTLLLLLLSPWQWHHIRAVHPSFFLTREGVN